MKPAYVLLATAAIFASPSPLVIALHGCTQKAADFEAAGWSTLAESKKFYVVYPEQTSGNNPVSCFKRVVRSLEFVEGSMEVVEWKGARYLYEVRVYVPGDVNDDTIGVPVKSAALVLGRQIGKPVRSFEGELTENRSFF